MPLLTTVLMLSTVGYELVKKLGRERSWLLERLKIYAKVKVSFSFCYVEISWSQIDCSLFIAAAKILLKSNWSSLLIVELGESSFLGLYEPIALPEWSSCSCKGRVLSKSFGIEAARDLENWPVAYSLISDLARSHAADWCSFDFCCTQKVLSTLLLRILRLVSYEDSVSSIGQPLVISLAWLLWAKVSSIDSNVLPIIRLMTWLWSLSRNAYVLCFNCLFWKIFTFLSKSISACMYLP